jgi:hypothetical protein
MIFTHQKFKHCFVACCASFLGKNSVADQESIVAQFPVALQRGTEDEGVAKTSREVYCVIMGLGLSVNPGLVFATTNSYAGITQFLKSQKTQAQKMMFFTKHPTNHSIRIKDVTEEGIIVMDPAQFDFTSMTWAEFEATKPTILCL